LPTTVHCTVVVDVEKTSPPEVVETAVDVVVVTAVETTTAVVVDDTVVKLTAPPTVAVVTLVDVDIGGAGPVLLIPA